MSRSLFLFRKKCLAFKSLITCGHILEASLETANWERFSSFSLPHSAWFKRPSTVSWASPGRRRGYCLPACPLLVQPSLTPALHPARLGNLSLESFLMKSSRKKKKMTSNYGESFLLGSKDSKYFNQTGEVFVPFCLPFLSLVQQKKKATYFCAFTW